MDRQILLNGIDPLEFFGVNNSKINLIKKRFPKIKITARGNSLFIQGEESELDIFEKKFTRILDHYSQFNVLTEEIIHEILDAGISKMEANSSAEKDIIVLATMENRYVPALQTNENCTKKVLKTTCFLPLARPEQEKLIRLLLWL